MLIDGQQRISTILLILKVICEHSEQLTLDTKNSIKFLLDYLRFDSFNVSDSDNLIKLIKSNDINLSTIDKNSIYYKNYLIIKNYFCGDENIQNFYDKLFNNVYFSEITFDDDVNENLIFSQINSTGKMLTAFDLFKNDILSKLMYFDELNSKYKNTDELIEYYSNKIDFVNNYLNEQKNESSALLRTFLAYKTKNIVNKQDKGIYKEYIEYYKKIENPIIVFDEYFDFAVYYKFFLNKEYKDYGFQYEFLVIEKQFGTYVSLLIDILKNYSSIENSKVIINDLNGFKIACSILESYVIKRAFCNLQSKVITRFVPTVSFDIQLLNRYDLKYYEKLYFVLILYPIMKSNTDEVLEYACPNEFVFKNNFINNDIYNKNQNFCKNFLIRIATYDNKNKIDYSNYTIEHVLPQSFDKWIKNGFSDSKFEMLDLIKNTIGNLTLTPHNSEYSNETFEFKKNLMKEKESFCLNNYFLQLDEWNSDSIEQRSLYLYENKVNKIWNFEDIVIKIKSKISDEEILNFKSLSKQLNDFDKVSVNVLKNKTYFFEYNITYEKIIKMLKIYLTEDKGQEKVEKEVLNNSFKGYVLNSIFNFLGIDKNKKERLKENLLTNEEWINFLDKYKNQIIKLDEYIKEIR